LVPVTMIAEAGSLPLGLVVVPEGMVSLSWDRGRSLDGWWNRGYAVN
jgi:hypothetical protein